MTFREMAVVVIVLISIQMLVVWIVTVLNKQYFTGKAAEYALCIKRLGKDKPLAALTIKICYGASLLEVFVLSLLKP